MPHICLIRTDIDPGLIQVLDLQPNTSQRNSIYDPAGQTSYVSLRPGNDTVVLTGAGPITTVTAATGLAAYFVDTVDNTGGSKALTAAEANAIADAIILRMDSGLSITLVDINVEINVPGTISGSDLDGTLGTSIGTVDEVLRILSGEAYTIAAGVQIDDGSADFPATRVGSFAAGSQVRRKYVSGAFNISVGEGKLSVLKSATFTYGGTAGAAVVIYDDAGNVL